MFGGETGLVGREVKRGADVREEGVEREDGEDDRGGELCTEVSSA